MKVKLWQDWVLLVAAAWLFAAPFVLGFAALSHPAAVVAWVCAIVLFVSASEALVVPDAIEEWVDSVAGLVLMISPWVLGFSGEPLAAWNSVTVGLVVVACAISALARDLRTAVAGHHGMAKH